MSIIQMVDSPCSLMAWTIFARLWRLATRKRLFTWLRLTLEATRFAIIPMENFGEIWIT